jgi:hypothetical protein
MSRNRIEVMNLSQEVLTAALDGLQAQLAKLDSQIAEVRRLLGAPLRGRRPKPGNETKGGSDSPSGYAPARKKRRKLSAAARKRMADAQKRRWAAVRAGKSA